MSSYRSRLVVLALGLGLSACFSVHDTGTAPPEQSDGGTTQCGVSDGGALDKDAPPLGARDAGHDAAADGGTELQPDAADAADASASDSLDAATELVDASMALEAGGGDAGGPDVGSDAGTGTDAGAEPPPLACPVGEFAQGDGCVSANQLPFDVGFARCRIRDEGTLWCWGQVNGTSTTWQQFRHPVQVGTDSDWKTISVGDYHACGVKQSGRIACFGEVYSDAAQTLEQTNDPEPVDAATDWKQVSSGAGVTCAVKQDGTLHCWGYTQYLLGAPEATSVPVQVGVDQDWDSVTVSNALACAIKHNGELYCWGYNMLGHVGDGTSADRTLPTLIAGGPWAQVALGAHTCALKTDGTLWCWGQANGIGPRHDAPELWSDWSDWQQLSGHVYHVCGLRAGGQLACLDDTKQWTPKLIDVGEPYVVTSAWMAQHADGSLRAWGSAGRGDGSGTIEPLPVRHGMLDDWTHLEARSQWVIGLRAGGVLQSPGSASGTSGWTSVATSGQAACAIKNDRTLWCWGSAFYGAPDAKYPQGNRDARQSDASTDWLAIAMTANGWSCGIRDAGGAPGQGTLWCSLGAANNNRLWTLSDGNDDWTTLSAGDDRVCGTRANGSLWCKVIQGYATSFTQVDADLDWEKAAAGFGGACGLKHGGELWCWGKNFFGQLGIGTHALNGPATPTHVQPGTHWLEVSPAAQWTCAIRDDHSLWCWGQNTYGQLGVGSPGSARLTPQRVGTHEDWDHVVTMSNADQVTCALRHGERWCWGQNQIGFVTGSSTRTDTPAIVIDEPDPNTTQFCWLPQDYDGDGYADCLGDCSGKDFDVNPAQTEVCNGKDDDCDAQLDEGCP